LTGWVIDGIPDFVYVEVASNTGKVKTMAFIRSVNVKPEIVYKTQCDMHYACLSGNTVCKVEPFIDRDVQLLRCKDERSCSYKKKYQGRFICTCPVKKASFSRS
jgi:hypothetical protein